MPKPLKQFLFKHGLSKTIILLLSIELIACGGQALPASSSAPSATISSVVSISSSSLAPASSSSMSPSSSSIAPSSSSIKSSSSAIPSSSSAPLSSRSQAQSSSAPAENLITTRPDSGEKQISVGGTTRKYNIYVPSSYPTDRKVPLVIRYHGLGGNGGSEITSTGYRKVADSEGFILVAPSGAPGSAGGAWNVGTCCTSSPVDDVAFAKAIIAAVKKVANIDNERIYATGFSMGGGMTHYLACHASDVFAAFAPEAFDLLKENVEQCKPSRAVPLLSQRASNDTLVKYDGVKDCMTGVCINFLGAVATNNTWKTKNGCTSQIKQQGNCAISTQCTDGVEVGLCTNTIGHSPADANIGWNFMKQFTLN